MPQRIRAGCDGCLLCVLSVLCYLCHSAFARVATYAVAILAAAVGDFATAHSRGLRPVLFGVLHAVIVFATAHSRGLRREGYAKNRRRLTFATAHSRGLRLEYNMRGTASHFLCHSAFARVATGCTRRTLRMRLLCHSAFARVATQVVRCKDCLHFLCHSAFARVATAEKQCSALRICCEKVDSFSSVGESGLALTIFPFSFAAKATYVAINDSFGRAIDRFFGANRTGISVNYDFAEHPCL